MWTMFWNGPSDKEKETECDQTVRETERVRQRDENGETERDKGRGQIAKGDRRETERE